MRTRNPLALVVLSLVWTPAHAELRVPAFTAYLDPNPEGARVSESGITDWKDPTTKVLWFGQIKTAGKTELAVTLRLVEGATSRLRLAVAGQSREASAKGEGAKPTTVRFGAFDLPATRTRSGGC